MARAYWDFRDELSTDDGLLLKGPCIVIPSCLHEEYLERLHYGHLSARKVQQNTRQHLYWPRLDADVTDYMRRCQECIKKAHPPKEPLQAHDVPSQLWERIAMDHFYHSGRLYLIVCDYFSKFPFIFQTKSTSFANIKDQLEELFGLEGTPDEIMSDNGPPFSSREFNSFLSGLGIKHHLVTKLPPQSNGFIERQIQTVKRLMEKANSTGRSFKEALTGLRATPIAEGIALPAETLHGRSLVTRKAISVDLNAVRQHLIQLQAKYIKQHDKARWARWQRALVIGEEVYHLTSGNNWVIDIISGTRDSGRSYDILTEGGTSLRRNRSHLKPRSHNIPMLNQAFTSRTHTSSQSEIFRSGPAHPPKRNIVLEQATITTFRTFQDQHTLPKRNILFLSRNLCQNWSLDVLEILPMTRTLQRHWFHWGAPSSQGNRPDSRATQWPVSGTYQLDVDHKHQLPDGPWTHWIQTCWYQ